MAKPAVFLDRDGVINSYVYNEEFGTVDSPANPEEFVLMEGAASAVAHLNALGLPVVVVSNQPGVAKKKFSRQILDAMTDKMMTVVGQAGGRFDRVYYCLHHPEAVVESYRVRCECRKPKPGLLTDASRDLDLDLRASFMIGDGVQDIAAGATVGCSTIFVGSRKCYLCNDLAQRGVHPDYIVPSLGDAAGLVEALIAGIAQPHRRFPCLIP